MVGLRWLSILSLSSLVYAAPKLAYKYDWSSRLEPEVSDAGRTRGNETQTPLTEQIQLKVDLTKGSETNESLRQEGIKVSEENLERAREEVKDAESSSTFGETQEEQTSTLNSSVHGLTNIDGEFGGRTESLNESVVDENLTEGSSTNNSTSLISGDQLVKILNSLINMQNGVDGKGNNSQSEPVKVVAIRPVDIDDLSLAEETDIGEMVTEVLPDTFLGETILETSLGGQKPKDKFQNITVSTILGQVNVEVPIPDIRDDFLEENIIAENAKRNLIKGLPVSAFIEDDDIRLDKTVEHKTLQVGGIFGGDGTDGKTAFGAAVHKAADDKVEEPRESHQQSGAKEAAEELINVLLDIGENTKENDVAGNTKQIASIPKSLQTLEITNQTSANQEQLDGVTTENKRGMIRFRRPLGSQRQGKAVGGNWPSNEGFSYSVVGPSRNRGYSYPMAKPSRNTGSSYPMIGPSRNKGSSYSVVGSSRNRGYTYPMVRPSRNKGHNFPMAMPSGSMGNKGSRHTMEWPSRNTGFSYSVVGPSRSTGYNNPVVGPTRNRGYNYPMVRPSVNRGIGSSVVRPSGNRGFSHPMAGPLRNTGFGSSMVGPLGNRGFGHLMGGPSINKDSGYSVVGPSGNRGFSQLKGGPSRNTGFSYSVVNDKSKQVYGHQASFQQKSQEGSYFVHFSDGTVLLVTYTADHLGYRPVLRYFKSSEELNAFFASNSNKGYDYSPSSTKRPTDIFLGNRPNIFKPPTIFTARPPSQVVTISSTNKGVDSESTVPTTKSDTDFAGTTDFAYTTFATAFEDGETASTEESEITSVDSTTQDIVTSELFETTLPTIDVTETELSTEYSITDQSGNISYETTPLEITTQEIPETNTDSDCDDCEGDYNNASTTNFTPTDITIDPKITESSQSNPDETTESAIDVSATEMVVTPNTLDNVTVAEKDITTMGGEVTETPKSPGEITTVTDTAADFDTQLPTTSNPLLELNSESYITVMDDPGEAFTDEVMFTTEPSLSSSDISEEDILNFVENSDNKTDEGSGETTTENMTTSSEIAMEGVEEENVTEFMQILTTSQPNSEDGSQTTIDAITEPGLLDVTDEGMLSMNVSDDQDGGDRDSANEIPITEKGEIVTTVEDSTEGDLITESSDILSSTLADDVDESTEQTVSADSDKENATTTVQNRNQRENDIVQIRPPPSPTEQALLLALMPKRLQLQDNEGTEDSDNFIDNSLMTVSYNSSSLQPTNVTPIIPYGNSTPEYITIAVFPAIQLQEDSTEIPQGISLMQPEDNSQGKTSDPESVKNTRAETQQNSLGLSDVAESPQQKSEPSDMKSLQSSSLVSRGSPSNRRQSRKYERRLPFLQSQRLRPSVTGQEKGRSSTSIPAPPIISYDREDTVATLLGARPTFRRNRSRSSYTSSTRNARLYRYWLNRRRTLSLPRKGLKTRRERRNLLRKM